MIQLKIKKCKYGTNKALGFPGCGSEVYKTHYGLCAACEYDWLTHTEIGKIEFEKRKIKVNRSNWSEKKKELKQAVKTLSDYESEAKKSFQKWIRLRDEGKPCISCNKFTNDPAGGHFYAAGIYSGLMFNPNNCHLQCNVYCNRALSGNLLEYRKGLINRYGIEFVENLDNISNEKRNYKYTKEELMEIKKNYDLKFKNNDFT